MNKKYILKAKIVFKGKNPNLCYFLEDYLSQQICSRWGSSNITEHNADATYTELSLVWYYKNPSDAHEDCHCMSQSLSVLKSAGIIPWFYTNSSSVENMKFQKEPEFNVVNLG